MRMATTLFSFHSATTPLCVVHCEFLCFLLDKLIIGWVWCFGIEAAVNGLVDLVCGHVLAKTRAHTRIRTHTHTHTQKSQKMNILSSGHVCKGSPGSDCIIYTAVLGGQWFI